MNKKVNTSKNFYIIASILVLAIVILGFTISYFIIKNNKNNKMKEALNNSNIYENIYIENVNVSNLSKEEAISILKEQTKLDGKIILETTDKNFEYNKSDLGFEYDFEKSVEEAYKIGREGNEKNRFEEIENLKENPRNIPLYYKLNEEKLNLAISELEKILNEEPINPRLIKQGDNFELTGGEPGKKLNKENFKENLQLDLEEKGDLYLQIQLDTVEPKGTEDLKMIKNKLGSFTTNYTGASTEGRVINMKIAASKINGTILYPEEVFSTNEKFGPTTKANGYKPAKTIIDGKFVDDFGGGVCQISSTLYNAVLYSELDIVERQNHSLKVGYLDYGYDATLAGNYIDLKFKNSTKYPIYIESYLTDNQVICNIYGYDERPQNREIKFQNALVEKIEPGPRVVKETDTLPEGKEKVEVKPLTGYKYKLYKLVYQDGKLTDKILVNSSYYRPRAEEVLVGTNTNGAQPANASNDETISTQTEVTSMQQEIITETTTQNIMESTTEAIIETTIEITTIQTEENIIETESTENLETTESAVN